ncbi:MAG: OmpH family outer membrane protein [Desulfobulbaceae bacterium]|uniref:OmpH family outer membrane protein n=1 Tax=Candidatus Desulfatifera sulfidica TaxID=2841691 RepID=A0A8J6N8H3_9BACT|nr:OmpH family outer membrane protein [Candidatus Desulfatifera sulfidica]
MMIKRMLSVGLFCAVMTFTVPVLDVQAAETKIGVMNIQQVLLESTAGKAARDAFEKKAQELQAMFQVEEDELMALQQEIEKKSSAWSQETKDAKVREYQKKGRDLQIKTDDARAELKQLQDREIEPILKNLQVVVEDYAKKEGYTAILDSKAGVLFFDDNIDLSDKMVQELNKQTEK